MIINFFDFLVFGLGFLFKIIGVWIGFCVGCLILVCCCLCWGNLVCIFFLGGNIIGVLVCVGCEFLLVWIIVCMVEVIVVFGSFIFVLKFDGEICIRLRIMWVLGLFFLFKILLEVNFMG